MKILSFLLCAGTALSHYHYIYGNNGYPNNNNYGNNEENVYTPAVPYVLPLTFLRKVSPEAAKLFKKIGQNPSTSVKEVEEQRLEWAEKYGVERDYKEFAKTGKEGVKSFLVSVKKLISKLDHFFTKSRNIENNHEKSYKDMQKAVKDLLSGLSEQQQMVISLIINTYGINFFPFLNDAWCNRCIEDGGYTDGNNGYPENNGGYPGNGGGYPNGGYPGNNEGHPGFSGGYPHGSGGFPGVRVVYPGGYGGFQGTNGGFSGSNGGFTGNYGAYPDGNGWFPGTGYPKSVGRSQSKALEGKAGKANPIFGNGYFHEKK